MPKAKQKWQWPLIVGVVIILAAVGGYELGQSQQQIAVSGLAQFKNKLVIATNTVAVVKMAATKAKPASAQTSLGLQPASKATAGKSKIKTKISTTTTTATGSNILRKLGQTCDDVKQKCDTGLKCADTCGITRPGQICPMRCIDENQPPVE